MFDLTIGRCQLYLLRGEINKIPTPIKYMFEKFTKIIPCRLPLQLHRTDYTVIRRSHLYAFVTSEVQHAVTLCGKWTDGSFRYVIVYRIITIIKKSKSFIPELVHIVESLRKVRASFRNILL